MNKMFLMIGGPSELFKSVVIKDKVHNIEYLNNTDYSFFEAGDSDVFLMINYESETVGYSYKCGVTGDCITKI
jgi:hypothetical protein